jgi:hypothetical protein
VTAAAAGVAAIAATTVVRMAIIVSRLYIGMSLP